MQARDGRPWVLCVEDEPLLRQDLREELEEAGYQVQAVADVPAALQWLRGQTPQLIVCDIGLPGPSGLDLMAQLRQSEAQAHIPFVLLTAYGDRAHVLQGTRAGADDYLVKPVDYDLLLATIARRLDQVERLARRHGQQWHGVLDRLGQCALVCDAQLSIRFANQAAQAQAQRGDEPASPMGLDAAGRLVLRPALARDPRLLDFVQARQDALCIDVAAVPGGPPLWRLTGQLLAQSRPPLAHDLGQWVLFIHALHQSVVPSAQALVQQFGLTPTEAQVACRLAEGLSKQQICAQLQISTSTVAFHLRNLFDKTGTGRQAELVAVLLTAAWGASASASPRA